MQVNTNISSMRTQEYLRQNQANMEKAMTRLSSGKRINSAADDAAGLAIATRMKARESGLNVASRNSQDGISLIQTAESGLNSVSNILTRMRDLAVQSANGANQIADRSALDKEFQALSDQIDYIADNTQFNGLPLLNDASGAKAVQIKSMADDDGTNTIDINISSVTTAALGVGTLAIKAADDTAATADTDGITAANSAITAIDAALKSITNNRAELGATLNRLDYNVENLNAQSTSTAAAASQIQDADMAKEMSDMTKFKILSEAGISMLSQANQSTQSVSKLLQG